MTMAATNTRKRARLATPSTDDYVEMAQSAAESALRSPNVDPQPFMPHRHPGMPELHRYANIALQYNACNFGTQNRPSTNGLGTGGYPANMNTNSGYQQMATRTTTGSEQNHWGSTQEQVYYDRFGHRQTSGDLSPWERVYMDNGSLRTSPNLPMQGYGLEPPNFNSFGQQMIPSSDEPVNQGYNMPSAMPNEQQGYFYSPPNSGNQHFGNIQQERHAPTWAEIEYFKQRFIDQRAEIEKEKRKLSDETLKRKSHDAKTARLFTIMYEHFQPLLKRMKNQEDIDWDEVLGNGECGNPTQVTKQ